MGFFTFFTEFFTFERWLTLQFRSVKLTTLTSRIFVYFQDVVNIKINFAILPSKYPFAHYISFIYTRKAIIGDKKVRFFTDFYTSGFIVRTNDSCGVY